MGARITAAAALATLLIATGGALAASSPYPIISTSNARVIGPYLMHGRVTAAVNVTGEHAGQRFTRIWVFLPRQCGAVYCQHLLLRRTRGAGTSTLTLNRGSDGTYRGMGTFTAPLQCLGKIYPRGETVPYTMTVRVTKAVVIGQTPYAIEIKATYKNTQRIDHTRCPLGGPSHDAAVYKGVQATAPGA